MSELTTAELATDLRVQIKLLKRQHYDWGVDNSFWMLTLKLLGTAFAGSAAVAAVFEHVDRAWAASFVAVSGALFLLLQQLRFSDRANAHYQYADDLLCLLAELDWQTSRPIKDHELREISEKLQKVVAKHRKVFVSINHLLGQQSTQHEEALKSRGSPSGAAR